MSNILIYLILIIKKLLHYGMLSLVPYVLSCRDIKGDVHGLPVGHALPGILDTDLIERLLTCCSQVRYEGEHASLKF